MSNIKKTDIPMPPEQKERLDRAIENSDYMRGYRACQRKYERGPVDMKVHLGGVPDKITQEVINWFVNYCPIWGITLKNNTWQYHLANHFYNLGIAHERKELFKLREEAMKKYNIDALKAMQMEYPITIDECFSLSKTPKQSATEKK